MSPLVLTFAESIDHGGSQSDLRQLEVRQLHLVEALSAPFEITAICVSKDANLDLDALVGGRAHLAIDRGALGKRGWGGVCVGLDALPGEEEGLFHYTVRIAPELALFEHTSSTRTFVERTTIEIAARVLGEATTKLVREHPKHPLRVQRGETDLHFASRLLEEEGVSYTFASSEDPKTPSKLVLLDAPEHAEATVGKIPVFDSIDPASPEPFATDVRSRSTLRTSAATLLAFDFRRPRFHGAHQARGPALGEGGLEHTAFTAATGAPHERDERAANLLASGRFERERVTFITNLTGLAPGDAIELDRSKAKPQRLIVTRSSITWREGAPLESEVTAVPATVAIRPEHRTPRPASPGLESAFVAGPGHDGAAGGPKPRDQPVAEGAEVHADEHGRIQIRFAWDHGGEKPFWARVDAQWAGQGHGAVAIPRVGSEVLVSHFQGDGDDPVVVGRVFNGAEPPPHPLPQGAAKTTWRSRSSPEGSSGHELTFDDKRGHERVLVVSERDLSTHVKHDAHEKVHAHASLVVGGSRAATIGDADVIDVGSLHEVRMANVSAADGAAAPDAAPLTTRREIVAKRITLTTGGATIVLDGPDIVIAGEKNVRILAGGAVSIQGEPYVHLNPPGPPKATTGDKAETADHVFWLKLTSDGHPLAGVRVHLSKEGDAPEVAETVETDGKGEVKIPHPKPANVHVKVAHGSDHAPEGVPVATVPTQPTPKAQPIAHDVPVHFEIIEPKPNTTFHLHTTPRMPEVPIEARVTVGGKVVEVGHVGWTFRLEGDYRVRAKGDSTYYEQPYRLRAGHVMTTPGQAEKYVLDPGELLGGNLTLDVHFSGGEALGGLKARKKISGLKVLGKDPSHADVAAYIVEKTGKLAWLYLRMFQWESGMVQFATKTGGDNTPGYPLYGPPSGVGIVQRDPVHDEWHFPKSPVTEPNSFFPRIFWNWKHNVDEGIHSFSSDYIERGRSDLDAIRHAHGLPMYPDGVLMRAAIRRYNGGIEYIASNGHYLVHPTYTNNPGYVNDVLDNPEIDASKYPVPSDARATEWP